MKKQIKKGFKMERKEALKREKEKNDAILFQSISTAYYPVRGSATERAKNLFAVYNISVSLTIQNAV